ncbi:MAG: sigma-54-dependent Fis family transcriptional regulator [Desulfobulbaceae bacterium]|nr:sigma-54-dependent Fis family transcriptional regulator [Desulfobulbaceae bacterium]
MPVSPEARILIVDGDESIRFTFQRFLSREGYSNVFSASSVDETLALARQHTFDLVICDIMLEGENGPDLLKKIRTAGIDCPVVMITGSPDIDSATEMLRLGAFDYISKPINKKMLLRLVSQALRHRALQNEKNRLLSENEKFRRHLEAVFRSVQDAIISVDRHLSIIQVNEKAEQWIADFSGEESSDPKKLIDLPGEFGSACIEDAAKVVESGAEVKEHRVECTTTEGSVRLLSFNAAPVFEEHGAFNGVVIVARDVTTAAVTRSRDPQGIFHGFVDNSPAMQEVFNLIENVGQVDTTVLITGESGTGKELAAEALHAESPRSAGPLIKVDCASIPEELLESELFGHKKGAFTGADRDRTGRILQADKGTLFLDEIGDISSRLQLRLLRFLQERTFYPVGRDQPVHVDVRVITATNADLQEKVRQGVFREDLYYRLRVVEVNLPPLRARQESIPLLVNHFISRFSAKLDREINGISDQALQALINYPWPGNVRELQHTIERACVMCTGITLSLDCFSSDIQHTITPHFFSPLSQSAQPVPTHGRDHQVSQNIPVPSTPTSQTPSADQADEILQALDQADGNKSRAAKLLGIDRSTLYRRMQRLNLS